MTCKKNKIDYSNEESNIETKLLAKNNIYYLIYNLLNMIFPFISGIYVARVLLQYDIGLVASAQNLTQYFVILSFLGIPTYGLREIAKYKNDEISRSKIYSELVIINFLSTLLFLTLYLIIILSTPLYKEHIYLYLVTGISIALNIFNISFLYEGMNDFKFISLRNIIFKAISFALLLLLVKKPGDYIIYAVITVIGTSGNNILNIFKIKKYVYFSFKNLNFKRHIKPICFLAFVNLAIEIYTLIDVSMLSLYCNEETVTIYSYASKIQKILIQVINTFTMTIVPMITMYYKQNKKNAFNNLISKTFLTIIILAVPMIIGIFFEGKYLITIIYGESYLPVSYVLNILTLLLIISPIGYLLGSRVLLAVNKEKLMIIPVSIGAIINVILNVILIQKYSEIGAAIASVISEIIVMLIYVMMGKKYFKLINIKNSVIKCFLANLLITIFLIIINIIQINQYAKLLVSILGSTIIYFTFLLLTKEKITCEYYYKIIRR